MIQNEAGLINDDPESNLDGITIGGKPLGLWLRHKSTDEKTREIKAAHVEAVTIRHGKHKPYPYNPDNKTGPKVSKRVRRLTDREIRKEYGIMSRPYETVNANIIWCIIEKGPITNNEMANELKFEKSSSAFAAIMTGIWHRLGDEGAQLIQREKKPGNLFFEYSKKAGVELSVDAIIEQANLWGKKAYREERLAERRQAFLDTLTEQEKAEELEKERLANQPQEEKQAPANEPQEATVISPDIGKQVAAIAQQQIATMAQEMGKNLGININLSGRLDIVFGLSVESRN